MFRAIFFDLGNVILPFDPGILAKKLIAHSSYSEDEILRLLWNPNLGMLLETGKITPEEFFLGVKKACGLKMSFDEFLEAFNAIFKEDLKVVDLLSQLKTKYPIGLISNTNVAHMDYIRKTFSFLSLIDAFILSHEVGLRKPDPAIYWHALERLKVEPRQAIFIDDTIENVKAAHSIGIEAIQFSSADKLCRSLSELGIIGQ